MASSDGRVSKPPRPATGLALQAKLEICDIVGGMVGAFGSTINDMEKVERIEFQEIVLSFEGRSLRMSASTAKSLPMFSQMKRKIVKAEVQWNM
nr:hypothetical protein Iba_chr01cCG2190 [Ipomoea batatas]